MTEENLDPAAAKGCANGKTWRAELSRQPPGEQNLLKKLHVDQPHVDLFLEEPAQQNDHRTGV